MTKTEKYEKALAIIRQLKNSKTLHFIGIKDMRVHGCDNYQGCIAVIEFIHNKDYVLLVYADKECERYKIDLDLFIHPKRETASKLLCYLLTVNLLLDFDVVFRFDSKSSVHAIAEIPFASVNNLCVLENSIYWLLDLPF